MIMMPISMFSEVGNDEFSLLLVCAGGGGGEEVELLWLSVWCSLFAI